MRILFLSLRTIFNNNLVLARSLPENIPLAYSSAPLERCLGFGDLELSILSGNERYDSQERLLFKEGGAGGWNPWPLAGLALRAAPVYSRASRTVRRNTATKGERHGRMK